jgi:hypothetical protein
MNTDWGHNAKAQSRRGLLLSRTTNAAIVRGHRASGPMQQARRLFHQSISGSAGASSYQLTLLLFEKPVFICVHLWFILNFHFQS